MIRALHFTFEQKIANYVRKLGYDDTYFDGLWKYLLGSADKLPKGVLNVEEERVLKNMVVHRFDGTREIGVIRISDGETIAVGHVIAGICAGLHRNKDLSLAQWVSDAHHKIDNLFAVTMSGDLGQTGLEKKNGDQKALFGPSGNWTTAQCPAEYNRDIGDEETEATKAEILGDIDGFLLGDALPLWEKKGVRLDHLLKMYYGNGVVYNKSYRSCNRWRKFKELVEKKKLSIEVEGFLYAYYYKYSEIYKNVENGDLKGIAEDTVAAFYDYVGRYCIALENRKESAMAICVIMS